METDSVYRERAQLLGLLSAVFPSVLVEGADPEEPEWPVLYVALATGQASWHISPEDLDLFTHVHRGQQDWDGHDTEEKYRRVREAAKQACLFHGRFYPHHDFFYGPRCRRCGNMQTGEADPS